MKLPLLVLGLLWIMGCAIASHTGTLAYQEEGINRCGTYYLQTDTDKIMVNTSTLGDMEAYLGKEVTITGQLVDGPYQRKCPFKHTLQASTIKIRN